jgi:hypothetical protein
MKERNRIVGYHNIIYDIYKHVYYNKTMFIPIGVLKMSVRIKRSVEVIILKIGYNKYEMIYDIEDKIGYIKNIDNFIIEIGSKEILLESIKNLVLNYVEEINEEKLCLSKVKSSKSLSRCKNPC